MSVIKDELKEIMIDPTFNVSTLLALYSKRQDDLREAHKRLGDEQIKHLKEVADIRELHSREIRTIEMENSKSSAESSALAIQTLNGVTITNADNLRNALNTTATTMSKDRNDLAQKIADEQRIRDENYNKRITLLEQSSYVTVGKEKVSDPITAGYMADIKELLSKNAGHTGEGVGMKTLWGLIAGGIILLIAIVTVIIALSKANIL